MTKLTRFDFLAETFLYVCIRASTVTIHTYAQTGSTTRYYYKFMLLCYWLIVIERLCVRVGLKGRETY